MIPLMKYQLYIKFFQISSFERSLIFAAMKVAAVTTPIELITREPRLNLLSKFDFGHLIALKYAKQWQAKERKGT
jgi:hypothetical protein